jgi:hypothetical protein
MPPARLVVTLPGLLAATESRIAPAPERDAGRRATHADDTPAAPHLARLLAVAGAPRVEPDGMAAALARVYGIERQQDWPLAAIRLAALGVDPETLWWLAADPVTLVAGRDDLRLAGAVTDLAADDAARLVATINAHFASDALIFSAPRPDAWFVCAAAAAAIATCPLATATGRNLRELLPTGADAGQWRRWHSEIQMLLHEHPVNVARERRGLPPANSVWFWGGGTCPVPGDAPVLTVAGNGIAAALAAHHGSPARPLPSPSAGALAGVLAATPAAGRRAATVVIAPDAPLDLAAVERDWAAPAWTALARGVIDAVTLIADGDGCTLVWTASRPGAWQRLAARLRAPDLRALLAAAGATAGAQG